MERHGLQFRDAAIRAASSKAGATHLLSEDTPDGPAVPGPGRVDPFDPADARVVAQLLLPPR